MTLIDNKLKESIDSITRESIDRNMGASIDKSSRESIDFHPRHTDQQTEDATEKEHSTLAETSLVEIDQHQRNGYEHVMEVQATKEGVQREKRVKSRKPFIPKHLRREVNKVELDGFDKRVKRVPKDMSFEDAYYKYRLDHDEDRWTDYSSHRSTSSAKSTECNAVRILTHEEFAAKHPHPPSPFYDEIDRSVEPTIDRQSESDVNRHNTPPIDRQAPLTYRVRLPSMDNDYINALRPPPKPLANPPEPKPNPLNNSPKSVQEEQESEGRRLRKRKEKIPKNLKREANDKEMDGFTKRVLRISIEKPFDEAYFTHWLWMFFRETKVTEEDIRRMFHQVREKMKHKITLTKKSDPGKFAIPCVVKGFEFPHSMCDTGASVSILPRIMADQLGLTIEPSTESFTFVDLSEKRSGGIIRDLEVQIGNALVPVDFHVLGIELNWNSSLLLVRSFLATVGTVCDMNKNKLCLTLIDPNIHYDPI
ncbi:hypothetical protein F2Q69_00029150 [Brassica cretica]|uniref:Aspartic peptidase DDI1-type domain-containing protein n=1 Tax=Brassica cretica TaxID=69181 RepID=A0A8S9S4Q5_BRACR|nr:hypothetical protein F2Q69_00029150 [Brassica cretica]